MAAITAEGDTEITLPVVPPARPTVPQLIVRAAGATDVGLVRSSNEDQFLVAELTKALQVKQSSLPQADTLYGTERGHLFVVADGMGGHQAGEQASALAVHSLEDFLLDTFKWFFHLRGPEGDSVLAEFQAGIQRADAQLIAESSRRPELRGMGTTLTMAYNVGDRLFIVHVGDSRAYLLRNGKLYRLTKDHTLVEEMKSRGLLTEDEAAEHQLRHVITNVLGGEQEGVHAEVHKVELRTGDVVALCTDGLSGMIPEELLATVLQSEKEPAAACSRLITEAKQHGGKDNVTVVVAHFDVE